LIFPKQSRKPGKHRNPEIRGLVHCCLIAADHRVRAKQTKQPGLFIYKGKRDRKEREIHKREHTPAHPFTHKQPAINQKEIGGPPTEIRLQTPLAINWPVILGGYRRIGTEKQGAHSPIPKIFLKTF
jgi:hypothetical protein